MTKRQIIIFNGTKYKTVPEILEADCEGCVFSGYRESCGVVRSQNRHIDCLDEHPVIYVPFSLTDILADL